MIIRKDQAEMSGLSLWDKQQVFMILSFFYQKRILQKNFLTFGMRSILYVLQ